MTALNISVRNLRELADLLNTVVGEAKFKFDKAGMLVRVVDPAHVAMINAEVPREAFVEYQIDSDEEIALDLEKLKNVLKLAGSNDNVFVRKTNDKLKFELGTVSKSITLLDNSIVTVPKIPQISSESFLVISRGDFERGLKAAEDVSDAIKFTLSPEEFTAKSASDSEDSEMTIPKDMLKEIKCSGMIKSLYPLEYLLKFVKSIPSSETLKLSFKDDYPLTIEFNFGGAGLMKGLFLLAPRTE
jgi:proliferating cell nuclear antigen